MPLITIITVVYNAFNTIEKSILSVINQDEKDFEYIIIDGGSSDGTIKVINKYIDLIDHFISEKDEGIYDAMNKGIELAKGQYLFFLGADDFLYDNNVISVIKKKIAFDNYDLLIGNITYTNNIIIKPLFTIKLLLHNTIHHQGAFYNRELFHEFKYDSNLKLISDYELNLILFMRRPHAKVLKLDCMISLCTDDGASRTMLKTMEQETNIIRSKHVTLYKAKLFSMLFYIKLRIWNAIRHN